MDFTLPIVKSTPDKRDWVYKSKNITKENQRYYPEDLDLRHFLRPIRNQGSQGTCAAQSAACMKEYQEKLDMNFNEYMSPQFVYNHRSYWNNNRQDGDDKNEDYGGAKKIFNEYGFTQISSLRKNISLECDIKN